MKKISSTDIARKVGVSRSTVSKVINGYSSISEETKRKVLRAIERDEYSPDISGRILAGKGTDTIAFFLFVRGAFYTDMLVNAMIAAMIDAAAKNDFHILSYIFLYPLSEKMRKDAKEVFRQRRADAAVVIGADNDELLIDDLVNQGNILSIYDQDFSGHSEKNRIIVNQDDEGTAFKCIEYLHSLGHRSIGIMNGDRKRHGGTAKSDGFEKGLKDFRIKTRQEWYLDSDFSEDSGYVAMKKFLTDKPVMPSAFAIANDSLAFGAMRALDEGGYSIPEDISIVAIDGHPLSGFVKPGLTTFGYDLHELADRLVLSVISLLKGKDYPSGQSGLLQAELIERESCRRI